MSSQKRVSSEGQEPQPSIEEQLEAAQSNAEELGVKIVKVYIDEGSSGSDPKRRAAFQAMCDEVESEDL